MRKKRLLFAFLFFLTLSAALGAGSYQKAKAGERGHFKLSLPAPHEQTVVLDVADQGLPKQLIQPNRMQISGSFVNDSTQAIPLQVKLTGFPKDTKIDTEEPTFDAATGKLTKPLAPKGKFSCKLKLSLPAEARKQYRMLEGTVEVYNPETSTRMTSIPVYIINSEIPDAHPILKTEKKSGHSH